MQIPKILVADDNPCDILLLQHAVARIDIPVDVQSVSDGSEVLSILQGEPLPDLLVLDFALPGTTGLDILQATQADPELRGIPALILSGLLTPEQKSAVGALGAIYMEKPFSLEGWSEVAGQIRRLLASRACVTAA